jgi:orotidine-5'-phosphate decarboxylase
MNSQPAALTPRERLIVALDFPTQAAALRLVDQVSDEISFFKIGLQLYTVAGPEIVRTVAASGAKVFLDLKLHDIPNTVAGAVAAAGELGVQMMTVHLSGGRAMLEAAVSAKRPDLKLLGVTVLTSVDVATLHVTGVNSTVEEQVKRLTHMGTTAGITGFVASPREAKLLRKEFPESTIVTPGIRPAWASIDDQRRFMTPREAIDNGIDYLVVGRPITADVDPREAVSRILEEISA